VGQLINLAEARADRSRPSRSTAAFYFALDCPISYLAAERVERAFGEIDWFPVASPAHSLGIPCSPAQSNRRAAERLAIAERQAEELRLPLVKPERFPVRDPRPAARAAVYAADRDAGRRFAVAAARLAFCGGFDLEDPELIGEAGRAAGPAPDKTIAASQDLSHDAVLDATARGMLARGVTSGPAIRIGQRWFEGLDAVPGASTFAAVRALYGGPGLRPNV
jgi:2-hydroxychromene-2-carboxylate isomerase